MTCTRLPHSVAPLACMRVIVGPVLVDQRICRIVSPVDSLLEVEEWVGEWWEPSPVPLSAVCGAPAATVAVLEARGVPATDWLMPEPRLSLEALERLMQVSDAGAVLTGSGGEPSSLNITRSRRRFYPGNRKFRRGRLSPEDSGYEGPERRRRANPHWRGPWRRATDVSEPVHNDDMPADER